MTDTTPGSAPDDGAEPDDTTPAAASSDAADWGQETSSVDPGSDAGAGGTASGDTGSPLAGVTPGDGDLTAEVFDALVAERDQFLDAYRRTAADFDNFRKQSQKRIGDEVARQQGGFVERLLPVLDAIEAGRAHGTDGDDGVEALAGQLFAFLEKEGLERVDPAGEPFDPNVAEAVMHEPGEGEPTVLEVLRTGYLWQGHVIRPAMVKVAG